MDLRFCVTADLFYYAVFFCDRHGKILESVIINFALMFADHRN